MRWRIVLLIDKKGIKEAQADLTEYLAQNLLKKDEE